MTLPLATVRGKRQGQIIDVRPYVLVKRGNTAMCNCVLHIEFDGFVLHIRIEIEAIAVAIVRIRTAIGTPVPIVGGIPISLNKNGSLIVSGAYGRYTETICRESCGVIVVSGTGPT